MPAKPVFPSIASVLAQHVDSTGHVASKRHVASKDHPLDTSSDFLSVWAEWAREWVKIHNSVQSSAPPLPNVFEQAFTVALNIKDIHPNFHMPEAAKEEQETAIIKTARLAQAVQVQVQVKLQAIQVSNPACCSLAPILEADTELPALSLPPSVLPIILVIPATPPIAVTSAPTHKQASSISTAERQPNEKYLSVPKYLYHEYEAGFLRRRELAKKTKEMKIREEKRSSQGEAVVA
jgi:hypothetical protein